MKHTHSRQFDLPFHWPKTPFHIVLVEPQIPPNTGNIARLCAATGTRLHLVKPMGFRITDAKVKRAGLDYWDSIKPEIHDNFETFLNTIHPSRCFLFSTAGAKSYLSVHYQPGDALVFGSETEGLSDDLLSRYGDHVLGIPMRTEHVRSLNLSSSAAIVLYEALRQRQI